MWGHRMRGHHFIQVIKICGSLRNFLFNHHIGCIYRICQKQMRKTNGGKIHVWMSPHKIRYTYSTLLQLHTLQTGFFLFGKSVSQILNGWPHDHGPTAVQRQWETWTLSRMNGYYPCKISFHWCTNYMKMKLFVQKFIFFG